LLRSIACALFDACFGATNLSPLSHDVSRLFLYINSINLQVWLESVPSAVHILPRNGLKITPGLSWVDFVVTTNAAASVTITVYDGASFVAATGTGGHGGCVPDAGASSCVPHSTLPSHPRLSLHPSLAGSTAVATGTGTSAQHINITIPSPKLWSPVSPFLYNATVKVRAPRLKWR
jgi:hypothetical protein